MLDGQCAIYEARPLICRTHGLAIGVDGGLDHCPLNFEKEPPEPEGGCRCVAPVEDGAPGALAGLGLLFGELPLRGETRVTEVEQDHQAATESQGDT